MMATIHIESITGTQPFRVTVCDPIGNNCSLIGIIGSAVPPEQVFSLPANLFGVQSIMLIISDINGCERLKILDCFATCEFTINVNGIDCNFTIAANPITVTPTPTPTDIIVLLRDNVPGDWIGISQPNEDFIFLTS